MRVVWWCGVLIAVALLVGCGGGRVEVMDPDDLPVSCVGKPHPGNCRGHYRKYYFDYRDNRCKSFSYSGCGGRVPFETLEDCINYCGASR